MANHSKVVVLGGGPGGYAAAFLAADLGLETTIVEADPRLGGTCLLRGCIPSKALLHVAKVMSEAAEMAEWGIEFSKPKISIDKVRARKEHVIDTLTGGLAQLAKRRNVRVINARGIFVDSQTLQLEGGDKSTYDSERLTFDHCILATGSVPAMPKMFKIDSPRVMDSTGALALADIPESLLVIGGGYIGLEMGTVYAELGSKVTVVELLDGLLPGADRDLVKPLEKRLRERFAGIHLGTKVVELKAAGEKVEVKTEGPEFDGVHSFDRVLVSIGRRPVTQRHRPGKHEGESQRQGLRRRQRAACKPPTRTSWRSATSPANRCSHTKRRTKAKSPPKCWPANRPRSSRKRFPPWSSPIPKSPGPVLTLSRSGKGRPRRRHGCLSRGKPAAERSPTAAPMASPAGSSIPTSDRVLGCGIVGSGAGELIAEAVVAIEMGCTVRDVADSIHPHPRSAKHYPSPATFTSAPRQKCIDQNENSRFMNSPQRHRDHEKMK